MLIFALDDERIILEDTRDVIAAAAPEAEIMLFTRAVPSLEAIREKGLRPDIVFCDIEMPGLSGLQYAAELKKASPETRIVFVTAYPQYAMDAFKVRAQGYILKPLTVAQVEEELSYLPKPPVKNPEKLEVRCFGSFEVLWKGRPLVFSRSKTKELFAYLVDALHHLPLRHIHKIFSTPQQSLPGFSCKVCGLLFQTLCRIDSLP